MAQYSIEGRASEGARLGRRGDAGTSGRVFVVEPGLRQDGGETAAATVGAEQQGVRGPRAMQKASMDAP